MAHKFQKLSDIEHVLKRPGMYIGSTQLEKAEMHILKDGKISLRPIEYVPGLYKIFDEILVNAVDHAVRTITTKGYSKKERVGLISVEINQEEGWVAITNDGKAIPVEMHKKEKVYVPELIFGNLRTSENFDDEQQRIVGGLHGLGSKCLHPDTLIPLYDGSIKMASQVQLGDILIGDDGMPREVLNLTKGSSRMFRIKQKYGEDYIVNENHTLTLHMPDHKVIFWRNNGWAAYWWNRETQSISSKFIQAFPNKIICSECNKYLSGSLNRHYKRKHKNIKLPNKERKLPIKSPQMTKEVIDALNKITIFINNVDDNNVIDISIKDFLLLPKTTQRRLAGLRGKCVQWKHKDVLLDPYILGLWLGDGITAGYRFACEERIDPEIISYLQKWCEQNDAILKKVTKCLWYISGNSTYNQKGKNPFQQLLRHYNLVNNKHIPKEYLVNSKDIRMKVLAGIIDTYGTVQRDGTRIIINQGLKHKSLAKDIIYLARSLGFNVSHKERTVYYNYNEEKRQSNAININISGDIQEIPTILPRKKWNNPKKQNMGKTMGYINIEEIPKSNFVGFEVTGNHRFVINDFTVTHNCSNIFSKKFIIDIRDSNAKKRYYQVFEDNMSKKKKPIIKETTKADMVKIQFYPDFERFGIEGFTDDMVALMKKRVYDMSACTRWLSKLSGKNISIKYNKQPIDVPTFNEYMNLYIDKELPRVFEAVNENWDVGVCFSENGFQQVSFVNSIHTSRGGKHVDYIVDQVVDKLFETLSKKNKGITLKKPFLKNNMMVFVRCNVQNPSFDSQTKETLKTAVSKFGTSATLTPNFIKKVGALGISEQALRFAEFKEQKQLAKTDGKKRGRVLIPKYDGANFAGTRKAHQCTLIVTEGDSAKQFAVSALSKQDRDYFGIFPLKGKPLNVRDQSVAKLLKNEEFNNLKQILGLEQGKTYKDAKSLRYGRLMVMSDQDVDGFHIKSLVFNLFSILWPSLFQLKDFLISFQTPLLKATKKDKIKMFFTQTEYERWMKVTPDHKTWHIKYLKGLGSSTAKEAKEYFKNQQKHLLKYSYSKDADKSFSLAFDKNKADDRKKWLMGYNREEILEPVENQVQLDDVIHRELIHFSTADTARSIPSMIDGLKPSQRKVLFAAFKRNLKQEIKVSQFAGYISENAAYHHGEKSLEDAIVNLAKNFIGSNNINLLLPNGQFGTRNNPSGAASSRYIFTALSPVTQIIFDPRDMPLLDYLEDDGQSIEPLYYVPLLPMSLINGVKGIGTGFSTTIPNFNPKDIIKNIRLLLEGKPPKTIVPWYRHFEGTVKRTSSQGYETSGIYSLQGNQVHITELPIHVWTEAYMDYLKTLVIDRKNTNKIQVITDIQNKSTDTEVDILLTFDPKALQGLIKSKKLEALLKINTKLATTNMHLFNEDGAIQKYTSVNQIIKKFFDIRMGFYDKRKKYMVNQLQREITKLNAKVMYILAILNGKIDFKKMSTDKVVAYLTKEKYPKDNNSYNYLLDLATRVLTTDNVEKLKKQAKDKQMELEALQKKTLKQLYSDDLDNLEKYL